jgi:hypothetical protein
MMLKMAAAGPRLNRRWDLSDGKNRIVVGRSLHGVCDLFWVRLGAASDALPEAIPGTVTMATA